MSLQLAPNEYIVKDWAYATCKEKDGNEAHSLTVTNKRVVAQQNGKRSARHIEIAVDNIKGMEVSTSNSPNPAALRLIIFGVILALIGALIGQFIPSENPLLLLYIGVGVGALFIIIGVILFCVRKSAQLILNIYTDMDTSKGGIFISANAMLPRFRRSGRDEATQIKVNAQVAEEIVETLGSIVLGK